jgi:hypothetical protein
MRYGVSVDRPRLAPFAPTAPRKGLHPALRDPIRVGLWLGGASLVIGSLLGWLQVWLPYQGWTEISSFERAGDGLITLELGLVLVALGWSERAGESRLAVVVAAPLAVGLFAFIAMRLAYQDGAIYLASLTKYGGRGDYLPGFWLATAGAVIATVAGAGRVFVARRRVRFGIRLDPATIAGTVGGVAGAVLGIGAAVVVGERLSASSALAGTAATFFAIVFGLFGAWLGARVLRSFVPPTP